MKKIICILAAILVIGNLAFGQSKPVDKAKPATKTTTAAPAKATTTAAKATKTKKDGTPDMRVKENKAAAKPAPKLKKDGTPDMRYKANKDAAKKK